MKVIVGAKLEAGPGRAPLDYSVVIVADGKFQAVGPQASTPVPTGAEMIRGLGMTIQPVPGGDPIEPGRAANLVMKGTTEGAVSSRAVSSRAVSSRAVSRTMRNGEWVQ